MLPALYTPPPIRVKQEEDQEGTTPGMFFSTLAAGGKTAVIKTEPMGPDAPWAMQAVTVQPKSEEPPRLLRVEPVHKPKVRGPWERDEPAPQTKKQRQGQLAPPEELVCTNRTTDQEERRIIHHLPRQHQQEHAPRWEQQPQPAETVETENEDANRQTPVSPKKHVSAANYAAVEAGLQRYGLIDEGLQAGGGRSLLIHVRKRCRPAFDLLNAVRPGTILQIIKRSGRPASLRVRATTPARYYSPGSVVTTLGIVVDEADWGSLTAVTPRI